MNDSQTFQGIAVAEMDGETRGRFVSRTYAHLFGAMCAFILIEVCLFKTGLAEAIANMLLSVPWLVVLGAFMIVSWLASRAAHVAVSSVSQYLALAGYVVAEALIFVPLLYLADKFAPGAISSAAGVTFVAFAALTAIVFLTGKDFSFLRAILIWGGVVAVILIIAGALLGFHLGIYFSVAMVAFAGAAVLYDTSNILHHYPEDRYVAASLQLFASITLMLWYVLRLFMSRR
jgi:uncharacterized protein